MTQEEYDVMLAKVKRAEDLSNQIKALKEVSIHGSHYNAADVIVPTCGGCAAKLRTGSQRCIASLRRNDYSDDKSSKRKRTC